MDKRLYRSKNESMIAGVAGGIAEYFSIDPVLIRLLFVLAVIFQGFGLLAYIILWIVIPQRKVDPVYTTPPPDVPEPTPPDIPSDEESELKSKKRTNIGAFLLIGLGLFFLADNFIPWFDFGDLWPLVLIAIGAGLLYRSTKQNGGTVNEI